MKVKWMEWLDCPFNWIQRIQINGLLVMCGAATPTPIHFILSFLPSISQFLLFYSLFCYNILSWATNQTKREGWVPSLCWLIALRWAQASPFKEWSKPSQELMKSIQLNSTHFSCLGSFLLFFNFISLIIKEIELSERRNGPQPATQPPNKSNSFYFFELFDWFAPPPAARLHCGLPALGQRPQP